jgi:hypothetical protein
MTAFARALSRLTRTDVDVGELEAISIFSGIGLLLLLLAINPRGHRDRAGPCIIGDDETFLPAPAFWLTATVLHLPVWGRAYRPFRRRTPGGFFA